MAEKKHENRKQKIVTGQGDDYTTSNYLITLISKID